MGRETTAGTATTATTLWRGMGVLLDARTVEFPEENIGILTGVDRSYTPKLDASISFDSVPATYQQILHILEAGVLTATPTTDGTGSDRIYTYNVATTAAPTIKTYTLEGGDNQQAEKMEYGFVESFSLEGATGEALMMSADWKGRQITNATYTASIAVPAVEEILFSKGKLYSDTTTSGFGITQLTDTLLAATLEMKTGIIQKWTADGNIYFSFHQFTQPEITLNVTFEHNTNAVAEKTNWRNGTTRALQLLFTGSAFTTAGTTYSVHTLKINLAGKWESFDALGEQDGNDIYDATFRVGYNAQLAQAAQFIVVNQLTAVP